MAVMVAAVRYFLVVFDRSTGRLVEEVTEFNRATDALDARGEREHREREDSSIEAMVLSAEDWDALEKIALPLLRRAR
jgi:hypothetical protein